MNPHTKDLEAGDITTSYRSGYFVVTNVERRYVTAAFKSYRQNDPLVRIGDETSALISMKQIASKYGARINGKSEHQADAGYCNKVDKAFIKNQLVKEVKAAQDKFDTLSDIIKEHEDERRRKDLANTI